MKLWFGDPRPSDSEAYGPDGDGGGKMQFEALLISADDEARSIFESLLEERGHHVAVCGNRWTAGMAVKRSLPTLVVVDWRMQRRVTEEILQRLHDLDNPHHCQTLVIADPAERNEVQEIIDSGVDDILFTPIGRETAELRLSLCETRALELLQLVRARNLAQAAHERIAIATRTGGEGLWDMDVASGKVFFDATWNKMLGEEPRTTVAELGHWLGRVHEDDRERLRQHVEAVIAGDLPSLQHPYRILHADGEYHHMMARAGALRSAGGRASRLVGHQCDLNDEECLVLDPGAQTVLDPLTGVASRAVLMDRLHHAFARAERKGGQPLAVLFFDLDRFKNVNDSLGHLVGDQLLVAIADRVKAICRPSDTVARFGGDEFVLVAEDVETIRDATNIADRLQQVFQIPFDLDGTEVYASVSTGIAMWHGGYDNPEDLLRDADNAMYRAKASGRNRYAVFDDKMHEEAVAILALENDLRRAISREEFVAYYQPMVVIETGEIVGFEVLARWQHPERGLLLPGEFIPLSEEMGVAMHIDRLVADEGCRQLRSWQVQFRHDPPLMLSINISTTQFLQADLVARIDHMLRQSGLYGAALKLEVTESVLMEDASHASAMLDQLRSLDIGISIDDFGTGYSSLSYLKRFEIDTLKIDYSFVSRMLEDEDSSEIVRTIANLAKNLGKETVAEGVETKSQLDKLREMKVDRFQGFYVAPGLPAEEITELLELVRYEDNHMEAILADRLRHGARRPTTSAQPSSPGRRRP